MSIKDYLQKKKDPEGYLQKRAHEILRELEDILARIAPKMNDTLSSVETFKGEKSSEIEQIVAEFRQAKKAIFNEVNPRMEEMASIAENAKEDLQSEITAFVATQRSIFSQIENKIASVQLMKGPKGDRGEPGVGLKGDKGDDGSPDTAKQIADKLNTTVDTVDIGVIKGLRKTIDEIKRAVRSKEKGGVGGGGMGQTQHETKNVSSATTTITTDYPISGGGYGIMGAYYQSAFIVRGEHYTVGGDRKTLTLLFTPEDNTKIDLVYVR